MNPPGKLKDLPPLSLNIRMLIGLLRRHSSTYRGRCIGSILIEKEYSIKMFHSAWGKNNLSFHFTILYIAINMNFVGDLNHDKIISRYKSVMSIYFYEMWLHLYPKTKVSIQSFHCFNRNIWYWHWLLCKETLHHQIPEWAVDPPVPEWHQKQLCAHLLGSVQSREWHIILDFWQWTLKYLSLLPCQSWRHRKNTNYKIYVNN